MRPTVRDVASSHSFFQAREWLDNCFHKHPACKVLQSSCMPKRLIDVGQIGKRSLVKLCTGFIISVHYAALSYCWGRTNKSTVVTTSRNLATFEMGILESSLPQTLRDAIRVTRELGIRYLWIDSLCILQDSMDDKLSQIGKMQEIYQSAHVTIAAAGAINCTEGFLHRRMLTGKSHPFLRGSLAADRSLCHSNVKMVQWAPSCSKIYVHNGGRRISR